MPGFDPHHIAAALTLPPRYEFTEEGVSNALAALGTTPNQIADRLLAGGHRGKRGCEAACPLADYLAQIWPFPDFGVSVLSEPPEDVLYVELLRFADNTLVEVDLPAAAAAFIRQFDAGHFGDLEADLAEVNA